MNGTRSLLNISIHAPRGGSDQRFRRIVDFKVDFNPRSPWGERLARKQFSGLRFTFQSTLPVGGATDAAGVLAALRTISIHAPRGGSDLTAPSRAAPPWVFQSTLPVGGATRGWGYQPRCPVISIHAPRGGSDHVRCWFQRRHRHFNPRSPWGERQQEYSLSSRLFRFQSTLPVGGATTRPCVAVRLTGISIHAPRGGSDDIDNCPKNVQYYRHSKENIAGLAQNGGFTP